MYLHVIKFGNFKNFNLTFFEHIRRSRFDSWCVFKPKIQIWVNFGGSCNGKCWYMYFMAIWSILGHLVYIFCGHFGIFYWLFGIFSTILVCCTNKNLAALRWRKIFQRLGKHFGMQLSRKASSSVF
jgi:hypothetical protein